MNRLIPLLTLAVLAGMAIILMFNLSSLFVEPKNERFLAYNGVRGIAVEHGKKLWTLNFEQQNSVIEMINRCLAVGKREGEALNLPVDRIVVYQFNAPDLFITPVGFEGDNLILESKELHPGSLLDISNGNLNTLLQSSYDP